MAILIKLNEQNLTHIRSLEITLSFRSGHARSDADALAVHFTREVGIAANAPADQLTFATMRGDADSAGIVPRSATIALTDDNADGRNIGEWNLGSAFVESYALEDAGMTISELTILKANQVTYMRNGGPITSTLKV
ncbi:MAG: hypothetical protein E5W81_04220 [Mesorhizobium sp.]|nr:MAG: hypothetical protein E5V36_00565 [Mesorhizobium sp.]TKB96463.1 MAG: hypothetical protein E5W81_04220 [Mesorhizobium sp.]